MTPELEPVDRLLRLLALDAGRPWPPDPYLAAKLKGLFACERARALYPEIERKITELEALRAMHELVQEEARELLELVDGWTAVGEEYARVMARAAPASPWPDYIEACLPPRAEHEPRKRWVLDEEDRWWREELDANGAWVRRSEDRDE